MGIGRKWKNTLVYTGIAAGSVAIALLLGGLRFFQQVHLKAYDGHFVVRGQTPTSDVVLLTIDQKALDKFEELQLFWHPYFAEAIRAAADGGAKAMGIDVTFAVPVSKWEPEHDRLLAEAVAETVPRMPVICGYIPAIMTRQQEWPIPVNMIAAALGMSAFVNLTVDSDDFVRRQELIEARVPDGNAVPVRSLSLRVAETFLGTDAEFDGTTLSLQGRRIPIGPDRAITINYAGPPGTFPRVSLWDFLEAARAGRQDQLRQWVEGKAVLLGPDTLADTDRHATPFYTAFGGPRWTTAGVEIHASTLQTILTGRFLKRVPEWGRILSLTAAVGGTVALVATLSAASAGLWVTVLFAGVLVATHLLFRFGWLLSTSELLLGCAFGVLFAVVYRFLTAHTRGEFLHRAVSLFVGRHLAVSLDETQSISLSAKHAFVTILFSDIRGFTAFSESKDPQVVVGLLNEYLDNMVKIIMSYRGNVNKFLGDGILVIFSDEDGSTPGDHPLRAVRCGIEMCQAQSDFKTGVGIHSGLVVIGNVGSAARMEFTVLGDTVNLASRIESMNKEQGTRLLMSEGTQALLDGEVDTTHLGAVAVRGHTSKLNIYTATALLGEKAEAARKTV
ncbi:MAG: adenylate/guanylate cyclase domain-containing protein [Bryobacteraceae bacterium]|nr:adenylate/guanylate cyclase domain-containing protein [Bryobacteraceae bacterium]